MTSYIEKSDSAHSKESTKNNYMRRSLGIGARFGLYLLLAGLILLGVFVAVEMFLDKQTLSMVEKMNSNALRDVLYEEWEDRVTTLTEMLARRFEGPLHEERIYEMHYMAQLSLKERDTVYILIMDKNGAVLVSTQKDSQVIGEAVNDELKANAMAADYTLVQNSGDVVDVAVPTYYGLERTGMLRIGYSTAGIRNVTSGAAKRIRDSIEHANEAVERNLFILASLIGLLAIMSGAFFVRSIGRAENAVINEKSKLQDSLAQLRQLAAHMENIREEERQVLSRRVHDDLGQTLLTLKMEIKRTLAKASDPGSVPHLNELLDSSIDLVKNITAELRPAVLSDFGLEAALESELGLFEQRTGIRCSFDLALGETPINQAASTNIYSIFREAVTNVSRHSGASRLWVALEKEDTALVLKIRDDGRGISDEERLSARSFGLMGMRERAVMLGGELHVHGSNGNGTEVVFSVPFESIEDA